MTEEVKKVYKAINDITGELAKVGIGKDKTASTGGGGNYKFRGIDDVYNALSELLAKYNLCIIPRVLNRELAERTSSKGNALFYVVVDVEYDLVSANDGSIHTARIVGEAMDSGDKATNKALSAAYKYLCFQTFCIPIEGDSETDDYKIKPFSGKKNMSSPKMKKLWSEIKEDIEGSTSIEELKQVWMEHKADLQTIKEFDQQFYDVLENSKETIKELLTKGEVQNGAAA